jgi:hypothetical protein
VEAVRDTLHEQCKDMRPVEYKEVLEELLTDIEGNLEALKEENEEEPDDGIDLYRTEALEEEEDENKINFGLNQHFGFDSVD